MERNRGARVPQPLRATPTRFANRRGLSGTSPGESGRHNGTYTSPGSTSAKPSNRRRISARVRACAWEDALRLYNFSAGLGQLRIVLAGAVVVDAGGIGPPEVDARRPARLISHHASCPETVPGWLHDVSGWRRIAACTRPRPEWLAEWRGPGLPAAPRQLFFRNENPLGELANAGHLRARAGRSPQTPHLVSTGPSAGLHPRLMAWSGPRAPACGEGAMERHQAGAPKGYQAVEEIATPLTEVDA